MSRSRYFNHPQYHGDKVGTRYMRHNQRPKELPMSPPTRSDPTRLEQMRLALVVLIVLAVVIYFVFYSHGLFGPASPPQSRPQGFFAPRSAEAAEIGQTPLQAMITVEELATRVANNSPPGNDPTKLVESLNQYANDYDGVGVFLFDTHGARADRYMVVWGQLLHQPAGLVPIRMTGRYGVWLTCDSLVVVQATKSYLGHGLWLDRAPMGADGLPTC